MSEHDRFVLQQMINEQKRGVKNTRGRARVENSFVDGVDAPAADCYLAAIGEDGSIPALSQDTTGTDNRDRPGSAICDVYKVVRGVIVPAGFQKRVYNISESTITDEWFRIVKDKFGTWYADVAGAGVSHYAVQAEVEYWNENLPHGPGAVCVVKWKFFKGVVPGQIFTSGTGTGSSDNLIRIAVYDTTPDMKVFVDTPPATALPGRWLWCEYGMPPHQLEPCELGEDAVCRWITSGLTCS